MMDQTQALAVVHVHDLMDDIDDDIKSNLFESFIAGRNKKTIEAYRQDLDDFRQYLDAGTITEAANLLMSKGLGKANAVAIAYKANLIEQGLAPSTINRRLTAIRSLIKFSKLVGLIPWTLEVQNVKSETYRDTRGPGREGFLLMLNALKDRNDKKGIRDRAILRLLYDRCLRRGEVVGLDLEDVDLKAGMVSILGKGKTQKETLTLPLLTKEAIKAWIEARGDHPGPLFHKIGPGPAGDGRLTGDAVWHIVSRLGSEIGIKVWPHGLRHASITEALDITKGDVRSVSKFSRHKKIETLMIYDDNRADVGGDIASMVANHAVSGTEANDPEPVNAPGIGPFGSSLRAVNFL